MKKHKLGSGVGFGRRTLNVEQLEQRSMLAGNVLVDVAGGNLIITGDNNDNAVLVQQVGDGEYLITGFDFDDSGIPGFQGGPTNINGDGEAVDPGLGTSARVVTGVTKNIIIDMKKGNDALGIGNDPVDLIDLANDCGFGLSFGSGSGGPPNSDGLTNTAAVSDPSLFNVPLNLIINLGDGNNFLATNANVGVSEVITGGKNSDNIAVGASNNSDTTATIGGSLVITTLKGDDNVCFDNVNVFGAVSVNTGDGFDTVGGSNFGALSAVILTGNQDDVVELESFDLDAALTINTGNANKGGGDSVFVSDFTAGGGFGPNGLPVGGGVVTVVTGNGNDSVDLENFDANAVSIVTGSGNDGSGAERSIAAQPISGPIAVINAAIWFDLDGDDEIDEDEPLGPLTIVTGAGSDNVLVEEVTSLTLTASLGAGVDSMRIEDVLIGKNLVVDAGADGDFVSLFNSTIGLITQFILGSGNDRLDIFESGGGTDAAMLIADGGAGKSDEFNNDLGVDSNGNFGLDENGVPHIIVRNFEFFETDDILASTDATSGKRKGW